MRIGKITSYFSPKSNASNSVNKQDLTSFGVEEQNKTQLLSKEAVTALKNKFASNVSFSGYFRTVNVKEEGEFKELDVECREYIDRGTSGFYGSTHNTKETYWVKKGFSANINGKEEGSYSVSKKDPDDAVRAVITSSDNFVKNSRLEKQRYISHFVDGRETAPRRRSTHPSIDYPYYNRYYIYRYYDPTEGRSCDPSNLYIYKPSIERKIKVYFADPNEEIKDNVQKEADYVVKAPEPPKKKTLLQRIFG